MAGRPSLALFTRSRRPNLSRAPNMLPVHAEASRPAGKRLLVVDDHPILRRGLTALIDLEPGLCSSDLVGTRAAALASLRESQPDLAIIDLSLGDEDGLDLIKEMKLRYPKVPSLALSMHDEAIYAERALNSGALGYVTKQQLDETVLSAIHRVLAGETYISETLQRRRAERPGIAGVPADRPGADHASDRRDAEPQRQDDRIAPRAHQEQAGHSVCRRARPACDAVGGNRPHRLTGVGAGIGFCPNAKNPPAP